jgi:hypothetical protein
VYFSKVFIDDFGSSKPISFYFFCPIQHHYLSANGCVTTFSDHHKNFKTTEIALIIGLIATPYFALVLMGTGNAIIIASRHRKTVQNMNHPVIFPAPESAQQIEQVVEHGFQAESVG